MNFVLFLVSLGITYNGLIPALQARDVTMAIVSGVGLLLCVVVWWFAGRFAPNLEKNDTDDE